MESREAQAGKGRLEFCAKDTHNPAMARTGALRKRDYFRDARVRVVVHREVRQLPIPQHRHEFYEIVLIASGAGVHVTGGFRHRLEAGDVLVIDPRRAHGYEETRGLNLVNVLVRDDLVPQLERDLGRLPGFHALFTLAAARWREGAYISRLHLGREDRERAMEWVDRMEEEVQRGAEGGHLLAEAYLALLGGLLARRQGRGWRAPQGAPPSALARLFTWIEMHLAEDLPVPRLAAQAGMSVRTFHRKFAAAAGKSPTAYVLERRLDRAAEWLRQEPELSVAEVALRCGFGDPNYFSRAFRAHLGRTPREAAGQKPGVSPGAGRTRRGSGRRGSRAGR
jgi:AraC-like DNA-binding protein/mannose-6-phosphate isomerase-like protein (cupin superfamily)